MTGFRQALDDGMVIAWRNLKRVPRIPELAVFAILQSIMFVLLFAFVFGGAIPLPGGASYREYLMPGIFAQTIVFATATTANGFGLPHKCRVAAVSALAGFHSATGRNHHGSV
jgi:ABC-2 type transport system permease protein